jgi:xylulokinase
VERFAGPQIRRFAKADPERYTRTELIHLVSSFMCSLMLGKSAPIDSGDGAGMNLLNLASGEWDVDLLQATARGLAARLPALVPSGSRCGTVAPYLVERYGFSPAAQVVAWSGDNPNSLIGVGGWRPGTAVISLGTSDTYFAAMSKPAVDPQGCGHVFGNPAGGFMCLICFKNGSLAREQIKRVHGLSWPQFDVESFAATPAGNGGNLMLPYFVPEITPVVLTPGVVRQGTPGFVQGRDAAASVRAMVEAQALSMKLHSGWIGETPAAIRVTGGASRSDGICQVLADVFNAAVERLEVGNSAALGAAVRAAQAIEALSWDNVTARFCRCDAARTLTPIPGNVAVYQTLLPAFAALEAEHRRAGSQ